MKCTVDEDKAGRRLPSCWPSLNSADHLCPQALVAHELLAILHIRLDLSMHYILIAQATAELFRHLPSGKVTSSVTMFICAPAAGAPAGQGVHHFWGGNSRGCLGGHAAQDPGQVDGGGAGGEAVQGGQGRLHPGQHGRGAGCAGRQLGPHGHCALITLCLRSASRFVLGKDHTLSRALSRVSITLCFR